MRLKIAPGQISFRDGKPPQVRVTATTDNGLRVKATFEVVGNRAVMTSFSVLPASRSKKANPVAITAKMVRGIRHTELLKAAEWVGEGAWLSGTEKALVRPLSEGWLGEKPGRPETWNDVELAKLALECVALQEAGKPHRAKLASKYHVTQEGMRDLLAKCRRRGLLTAPDRPDYPSGRATELARELARSSDASP